MTTKQGTVVCPAREICTNVGCTAEIIAVPIGVTCTKLVVTCEQDPDVTRISNEEIDMTPAELAASFAVGNDIAEWLVLIDAPVCSNYSPEEITSQDVLINGQSVVEPQDARLLD